MCTVKDKKPELFLKDKRKKKSRQPAVRLLGHLLDRFRPHSPVAFSNIFDSSLFYTTT
jgi:hypothetical protein